MPLACDDAAGVKSPLLSITGLEPATQTGWQGQALPWREYEGIAPITGSRHHNRRRTPLDLCSLGHLGGEIVFFLLDAFAQLHAHIPGEFDGITCLGAGFGQGLRH